MKNYTAHSGRKGFSLIDIVIYISLYAVLIGSVTVAVYALYTSNNHGQTQIMLVEEANFLQAKISWVISQAQSVTSPVVNGTATSTSSTILSVIPIDPTLGNPLTIGLTAHTITLTRGSSTRPLSNTDVSVDNLSFVYATTTGTGASLQSVQFSFSLSAHAPDGKIETYDVNHTQYLRK